MSILSLPKITASGLVGLVTQLVGVSFGYGRQLVKSTDDCSAQNQIAFQHRNRYRLSATQHGRELKVVSVTSKQIDATQLEASVSALSKTVTSLSQRVASLKSQSIPKVISAPTETSLPKKPSTLARRQLKIVNETKQD